MSPASAIILPRRPAVRMPPLLTKIKPADSLMRKRRGSRWGAFFHADDLRLFSGKRFALLHPSADTVGLEGAFRYSPAYKLHFGELLNLVDSSFFVSGLGKLDLLGLADAYLLADFSPSARDTLRLGDSYDVQGEEEIFGADALGLGEAIRANVGARVTDAVQLGDVWAFGFGLGDSVSLVDGYKGTITLAAFFDTVNLGESSQVASGIVAQNTLELVDQGAVGVALVKADAVNLGEALAFQVSFRAADAVNAGDAWWVQAGASVADLISLADAYVANVSGKWTDVVGLGEGYALGAGYKDVVSLVEVVSSAISFKAPDSTQLNELFALGLLHVDALELVEESAIEGPPVALRQALVVSGAAPVFINETNTYERLITSGGYLNETGTAELPSEISGSDTVNLAEIVGASVSYQASAVVNLAETIGANISYPTAEAVNLSDAWQVGAGYADSVTLLEAVAASVSDKRVDSVQLVEASASALSFTAGDVVNLSDVGSVGVALTFFDVAELGDSSAVSVSLSVLDAVNLGEALALAVPFFDSLSLVEAQAIGVTAAHISTVNLQEGIGFSISTSAADGVDLGEVFTLGAGYRDTVNLAEIMSVAVSFKAPDSVQLGDSSVFGLFQTDAANLADEGVVSEQAPMVSLRQRLLVGGGFPSFINEMDTSTRMTLDSGYLNEMATAAVGFDTINLAEVIRSSVSHPAGDVVNLADLGELEGPTGITGGDTVNLDDTGALGLGFFDSVQLVQTKGLVDALTHKVADTTNLADAGYALWGDTQTIINAFTTPPTAARRALINTLVGALRSALGISVLSQRFDLLYVLAAADSQAARINWASPGTYTASEVNSPTFTANEGFRSNGTSSYLNTGWDAVNNEVNFVTASATIGVWVFSHPTPTSAAANTIAVGAANNWIAPFNSASSGSGVQYRITDSTTENAGTVTTHLGLTTVTRTNSTNQEIYKNGASIGTDTDTGASGSTTSDVFICANNASGSPANYYGGTVAIVFYMNEITDAESTAIYNAFNAYIAGL